MEGPTVHAVTNADRTRRVDIFQRRDATFGFEESRWDAEDQAWIPFGRRSDSFTDTLERALLEAQGRVPWLAEYLKDGGAVADA
jgi:hypothetical protein